MPAPRDGPRVRRHSHGGRRRGRRGSPRPPGGREPALLRTGRAACAGQGLPIYVRIAASSASTPGGFAECTLAPAANVYPLPDGVEARTGALAEPLANGVHAAQARAR